MTHPLMVEAIESLFVPVLIHNNKKGRDAEILRQFNEPSWNNPVIRYLDSTSKDVVPREDGVWTVGGTAARMVAALKASKKKVPAYLQLIADENVAKKEQATFAMHCYWVGEVNLGAIPGVLRTSAGWIGSKEVVHVTYNPKVVSYRKLLQTARKLECASTVFAHNSGQMKIAKSLVGNEAVALPEKSRHRPVKYTEEKYHLRRQSQLRYLPLTQIQLAKVNAAVANRQRHSIYLSPRQSQLQRMIQAALKSDPKRLDGLQVPSAADKLSEYTAKLTKRLAGQTRLPSGK